MKKLIKVIVGIGISGSGKTTYLKDYAKENQYEYICVDDIRQELTGDAVDQSRNTEAWNIAYDRLSGYMNQSKNVVFDSTMVNGKLRKEMCAKIRSMAGGQPCLIKGVVFNTPLDIALERNASRDRKVPEGVIRTQNEMLYNNRPLGSDGFDSLQTYEDFDKEINKSAGIRESGMHPAGIR